MESQGCLISVEGSYVKIKLRCEDDIENLINAEEVHSLVNI